jgi:hypothetical protein
MTDLGWWLQNFRRSAFRLESWPVYRVPQEADMFAAFKRGEPVHLPDDHPWLETVRRHTRAGRVMERVRIIGPPLCDYERFELSLYPRSAAAGERIYIGDRTRHQALRGSVFDFWLFDDELLVALDYSPDGEYEGHRLLAGREALEYGRRLRRTVLTHSMPFADYTARTTG